MKAVAVGLAALAVAVVIGVLAIPVETTFGLRVLEDRAGVASSIDTTVTCSLFRGDDEAFEDAKDEACSHALGPRWTWGGALAAGLAVAALVVARRRRPHVLVTLGQVVVLVVAVAMAGLGVLGSGWAPERTRLPAGISGSLGRFDVALSIEQMDTPSVSSESAPPTTTRWLLLAVPGATDEAAAVTAVADVLRREGHELQPPRLSDWEELSAGGTVGVGRASRFLAQDDPVDAWSRDEVRRLIRRAAGKVPGTPLVLVAFFSL